MVDKYGVMILRGWEMVLKMRIDNWASLIEILKFLSEDYVTLHEYGLKKLCRDRSVIKFYKKHYLKKYGRNFERNVRKVFRKMLHDMVLYVAFHNEARALQGMEEDEPYNLFISILEEIDEKYGIITNMKYCIEYFRKNYQHIRNRLRKNCKREIDVYSRH